MITVLYTNVLVSGLINPKGSPGRIVDLLCAGSLRLAVDDRILAEYSEVLHRPSLAAYFTVSETSHILEYLTGNSERVLATRHIPNLPDPEDAPFLEVALTAGVPLVTGNLKHFPPASRQGCEVIPPADFLHRFATK